jgi:hypothetical protein
VGILTKAIELLGVCFCADRVVISTMLI